MENLKDEIFSRPQDEEEVIVEDNAHVVTDGGVPSVEGEGQKLWKERQKLLKSVT